ncbi:uncharacterized protein LOC142353993 [Convolutriloba macropyga]|uniref:uncharacterized protein LOC142353993 n=1 Tax=Convolutriloba macropyga TaxID=536237 RepID=UPI003F51E808
MGKEGANREAKAGTNLSGSQPEPDLPEHHQLFHTVAGKASGESGNAKVRLLPAPRGVGIVGAACIAQRHLLQLAGVQDCFVISNTPPSNSSNPSTGSLVKATLNALQNLSRLKSDDGGEDDHNDKQASSGTPSSGESGGWYPSPINIPSLLADA